MTIPHNRVEQQVELQKERLQLTNRLAESIEVAEAVKALGYAEDNIAYTRYPVTLTNGGTRIPGEHIDSVRLKSGKILTLPKPILRAEYR